MAEAEEILPWVTRLRLIQVRAALGRLWGIDDAQTPCAQPTCWACGCGTCRRSVGRA